MIDIINKRHIFKPSMRYKNFVHLGVLGQASVHSQIFVSKILTHLKSNNNHMLVIFYNPIMHLKIFQNNQIISFVGLDTLRPRL